MSTYIPRDAYEQEIIGAQQQGEAARRLREGIVAPQGQMIGNQFVAPSITQHLANILKSYMGGKGEMDAAQKIKDLQSEQVKKEQAYIAGIPAAFVAPDHTQANADVMHQNVIADALRSRPQQDANPVQTGTQQISAPPEKITQPNIDDYLKYAMNAPNDRMAALVQALGTNRQNAADKKDAFNALAEQKKELFAQQLADKQQQREWQAQQQQMGREQNFSNQQALARLGASLRPAPQEKMVVVADQNGNPVYVPQSQSSGQTQWNAKLSGQIDQRKTSAITAQQALDQAAALYDHPGRESGTGASSWMQKIPATDAKGFGSNLETFKAKTFLDAVQAMKGLGAITEAEGAKLVASVGSLDPSMKESEFAANLQKATRDMYQKAKSQGLDVTLPEFAVDSGAGQIKPAVGAHPEDITALVNQYGKPK